MAEVASAFVTLMPSARGFGRGTSKALSGELNGVGAQQGKAVGGRMKTGILGGLKGVAGPLAAIFAVGAGANFLKGSITQASDLSESINAVRVSYGKASDGVLALGKTSARTFGLSNVELNDFAVKFSGFAKQINKGDAASAFQGITERATDFASVMNLEVGDAAALFQSSLAGESEPIRRYGIDMSAAAVQAKALAIGLGTATKSGVSLTEAEKVQARYALLMDSTASSAGDFANTSGGLANQQRILGAQFDDLKGKIGAGLLPAVTGFVSFLNDSALPGLERFGGAVGPVFSAVAGAAKGLFDLVVKGDFTGALRDAFGVAEDSAFVNFVLTARDGVIQIAASARAMFASFRDGGGGSTALASLVTFGKSLVPVFQAFASYVGGTLVPIFVQVGQIVAANVVPAFRTIGTFVTATLLPALGQFAGFIATEILPRIGALVATVANGLMPAIRALAAWVSTRIVPGLVQLGTAILTAVRQAQPFLVFVVRMVSLTAGWAAKLIGFLVPIILRLAGPVFSLLIRVLGVAITWIGKIIGFVGQFGNKLLNGQETMRRFAVSVGQGISKVLGWFASLPQKIGSAIGGLGRLLYQKGRDLIQGLLNGASSLLRSIGTFFLDKVPSFIRGPFKKALGIASPSTVFAGFGANIGEGLIQGIRAQVGGVAAATNAITDAATPGAADFKRAQAARLARQMRTNGAGGVTAANGITGNAPVVNIVNNYPKPERASDSVAMTARRARYAMGV